jgi:iron complex transport system permease protein
MNAQYEALYIQLGIAVGALFGLGIRAAAAAGALLSMLLVYGIAARKRGLDGSRMLLAGVAVSFTFSGLLLFIQYLADFSGSFRIVRWLMGNLDVVGTRAPLELGAVTLLGMAVVLLHARALDLLTVGETEALTRGLNVRRTETVLFLTVSIVVGQTVSITGPIGFVGMMVPHICRRIVGPRHAVLLPTVFFLGGFFLVLADTAARSLISPAEIPVGVLTSLLGGPFFLVLLLRGR